MTVRTGCVLPNEIHDDRVAVGRWAPFDRFELRRALAQTLKGLVHCVFGDSNRGPRSRQRRQIAGIESGNCFDRRREAQRLPLLKRDVAHVRRVDRLDAAFLQRLFNRSRDEAVHHFVEDLFAEPLLDERRGNLAWPEPWDLDLLIALRDAIDLCVNNGAVGSRW